MKLPHQAWINLAQNAANPEAIRNETMDPFFPFKVGEFNFYLNVFEFV